MLKVDLHLHTADDPQDAIPYTTFELIDRAAQLGYGALAITLHDRQLESNAVTAYARARGITLIPGTERTICGKHVLLLNFPALASERVASFSDLAELRRRYPRALVIAPHPFYPARCCLRRQMDRHQDLFDAVEVNAFHTRRVDPNRHAIAWARERGKTIVANSDAHRLSIFGASYSLVEAEASADSICAAIKAGRVEIHTRPLSLVDAARYFTSLTLTFRRPVPHATIGGDAIYAGDAESRPVA
jgi:predicted metal-dependent phosphoesterase TrpH